MSFSLSDYRPIPSSGVIPDVLLPADEFSFAWTFIYEKDVDPSEGFNSDLNGHIVLEIRDRAGTLKATFDAKETYHIQMFPMAPGLAFYSWNWDSNLEKFTAIDAAGQAIGTQGQFSLGAIPAGDSGTTDKTAIVSSTFYSLIFNLDLSEGDTIKIKFHNLSAGFVVSRASLQIATRKGGASPALFDERLGVQLRAVSSKGQTRVVRSRRQNSPLQPGQMEWSEHPAPDAPAPDAPAGETGLVTRQTLQGVRLFRHSGGLCLVFGTGTNHSGAAPASAGTAGAAPAGAAPAGAAPAGAGTAGVGGRAFQLFQSNNGGRTFEQIMNEPTSLSILASCFWRDGSRIAVYGLGADKKPAYAFLKNGANGWTTAETGACLLDDGASHATPNGGESPVPSGKGLPTGKINSLEAGEGGALRLLSTDGDGTLRLFLSRDGKTWAQTALPARTTPDGGLS